jgi:hypothetical protein
LYERGFAPLTPYYFFLPTVQGSLRGTAPEDGRVGKKTPKTLIRQESLLMREALLIGHRLSGWVVIDNY